MRNSWPRLLLLAAAAAALLPPPSAAAQGMGRKASPEKAAKLKADQEALEAIAQEAARHLVRVKVFCYLEIRMGDGTLRERREVLEGYCAGIVLTPDPVVMISASALLPQGTAPRLKGISKPPNVSERQYAFVLRDGTELLAEIWRREVTVNTLLLRPADPTASCEELRIPMPLDDFRAPRCPESVGILAFKDPETGPELSVIVTPFPPGKETISRPVLAPTGMPHAGMPVFNVDGTLAGIINLGSPEDKAPKHSLDPRQGTPPGPSAQDPGEWYVGYRRPVLMYGTEFQPLLEALREDQAQPVHYALLGLTLKDDHGSIRVESVEEGLPAAAAALVAGDTLVEIGGTRVSRVEGFGAALEALLAGGTDTVPLRVLRAGGESEVLLRL